MKQKRWNGGEMGERDSGRGRGEEAGEEGERGRNQYIPVRY